MATGGVGSRSPVHPARARPGSPWRRRPYPGRMSGQPGPPGEAQPPQAAGTRPASHDDDLPDALKELMARGWEPPSGALPPREDVAPYARKRRVLLAARFPGEALVVPTGGARG